MSFFLLLLMAGTVFFPRVPPGAPYSSGTAKSALWWRHADSSGPEIAGIAHVAVAVVVAVVAVAILFCVRASFFIKGPWPKLLNM